MIDLFLMSPPGPTWALRGRANFRSQGAGQVDARAARQEWLGFARALESRGAMVVALPSPSAELTGMPYAAESGHILARKGAAPLFLLPRMFSAHRQGEQAHWSGLAQRMGLEVVDLGVGIWEAHGDVATFDGATLLFHGVRTNLEGMEAAARYFPGEVLRIELREPAFHGNMALLPLPAVDRMLVCAEVMTPASHALLEQRFGRERLLPVTGEEIRRYATNGLPFGRELLAPSVVPERVRALVEAQGMRVIPFVMRELCEKGGGASRCLVSQARLEPGSFTVPEEHRLSAVAARMEAEG
ncbi:dimethylarginine dimethylaminohydrolase family protein [Hyalangium rubrum]|uniref:Amidinotransferase n=1 Tax=Hyalangium rubrum TaxID=3103134 RepID=A0ABU5HHP0_9BACT|nr:amidinotransferase [Hyalangium sp. s54d21]MDY7232347.1 amidinotransferase [Hyalangium sp. s54d21]